VNQKKKKRKVQLNIMNWSSRTKKKGQKRHKVQGRAPKKKKERYGIPP